MHQGDVCGCPGCDKPYNPDQDIQRFCRGCDAWHHVRCVEALPPSMSGIPEEVERQTSLQGRQLDADLQSILCIPIERGGPQGIVGNGKDILLAWEIFAAMTDGAGEGDVPLTWRDNVCAVTFEKAQNKYDYYYCVTCGQEGHSSFM